MLALLSNSEGIDHGVDLFVGTLGAGLASCLLVAHILVIHWDLAVFLVMVNLLFVLDDSVQEGSLSCSRVADDEAVEHQPLVLDALSQDVSGFHFDRMDHVFHLATDEACVNQELVGLLWLLAERFLPEPNPVFE